MDLLHNLAIGFQTALTFQNLLYGPGRLLPWHLDRSAAGLGPVTTMAMLLPSVYALDATPALIMMAGIYYGAQYGGSTTAILIMCQAKRRRWSRQSTATRWRDRGGRGLLWPSPRSARSSQGASARW